MMNQAEATARVVISGAFECRDKDGVLLKTIEFKSAPIPLEELTQEQENGTQLGE